MTLFIAVCLASYPPHAFYVSVVRIHHPSPEEPASVEITVFSDDLQSAMKNFTGGSSMIPIGSICNTESTMAYFSQHLDIRVNDKPSFIEFTSCEEVGETHKIIGTFACDPSWNSFQIKADHLMEIFPTQTQMIYVHLEEDKFTLRLTAQEPDKTIYPDR